MDTAEAGGCGLGSGLGPGLGLDLSFDLQPDLGPDRRLWWGRRGCRWLAALVVMLSSALAAQASVTVLVEQPYGRMGLLNPAGHAAIYMDRVCAASPVRLRPCEPGELGAVISRYDGVDGYDWVAVPLVPYLYAVASADEVPDRVDESEVVALREAYRRMNLEEVAPDTAAGDAPAGNWYELVGAAYDRRIYGFRLETTAEQDAAWMARMNDRRNVQGYRWAWRNCADFARTTVDFFYPHAVRRSYIADLGITTPKSVARSVAHYGRRHPECELTVFVVPQVQGSLPRSRSVQGVAEALVKRYGIPLTVLSPWTTAGMLAAYVGRGQFQMPRHAPVLDVRELAGLRSGPPTGPALPPLSRPRTADGELSVVRRTGAPAAAGAEPGSR